MAASTNSSAAVQEEVANVILSFIEVATHSLLFYRGLYPPSVFEKRKEYGLACWMSRHPALNASIADSLAAAKPHLLRGTIESIVIVITERGRAIEQYSFDVRGDAAAAAIGVPATYR